MTALDVLLLAATLLAAGLAALRWLRVAQREHYLPGAATRFGLRWWLGTPLGWVGLVVGLSGAGVAVVQPLAALAPVVVASLLPLGLSIRGRTSKLAWTRRLSSLAGALSLVAALPLALLGALLGLRAALVTAAFEAMLVPLLTDGALALVSPLEEQLGQRYVKRAKGVLGRVRPKIIGITGSYGKTSTKGYLAHLLAGRYAVLASPRSYNNRAGLARTVNELLAPGTEILVAEMGAYGPGEIAALCAWLPPTLSIITAIGPVHLERFKSLERTLAAKSEIAASADVVVLNVDDERLEALAKRLVGEGRRVVRCAEERPDAELRLEGEGSTLRWYEAGALVATLELAPNARPPALSNLACALGAARALGCEVSELTLRVASLPEPEHRLEPREGSGGTVVLDDTFNSNPAGARLALLELERRKRADRRAVVVTPGIVELGPLQREENAAFAAAAAALADEVVVVGRTNRRALLEGAERGGSGTVVEVARTREEAVAAGRGRWSDGDTILFENDLPDHFP